MVSFLWYFKPNKKTLEKSSIFSLMNFLIASHRLKAHGSHSDWLNCYTVFMVINHVQNLRQTLNCVLVLFFADNEKRPRRKQFTTIELIFNRQISVLLDVCFVSSFSSATHHKFMACFTAWLNPFQDFFSLSV